jgi:hypothetical protein
MGTRTTGTFRLSPLAAIAIALALIFAAIGWAGRSGAASVASAASAATGGSFILGKANSESGPASLSSSRGTPLALNAPKNTAPLAVNRRTMVKNLNAQFVGGVSAAGLKSSGGDGYTLPNGNISLPALAIAEVATTGKLAAGTYYVTATAVAKLAAGDSGMLCVITISKDTNNPVAEGGQTGGPMVQAAETVAVSVHNNDTLEEWCDIQGTAGGSMATTSGITAIRISSSSGQKPATADQPAKASQHAGTGR